MVACSPSLCEVDVLRERIEDERDDSLLSLDDELMGDKYCDDDNIDVGVVTVVVEDSVVGVFDVDVAVDDTGNNEEVEF